MDKVIENIIDEITEEENISREKVEFAIRHMCNWTRGQLIDLNYKSILWSYFGSFSVIESRLEKKLNKEKNGKQEEADKSQDSQS